MDWFDLLTTTGMVVLAGGGMLYYVWRVIRTRLLSKHDAGQIMITGGLLILVLTRVVYSLPADAEGGISAVAVALVAAGFVFVEWHRRSIRLREDQRTNLQVPSPGAGSVRAQEGHRRV